jgi:hypothetical protein
MKHVVASLTIGACLLLSSAGVAFAADAHKASIATTPTTTGAKGPNGTNGSGVAACGSPGTVGSPMNTIQVGPPGQANNNSVTSAFNAPPGEKVYAGQNAGNSNLAGGAPASQYDNACFQHQGVPQVP